MNKLEYEADRWRRSLRGKYTQSQPEACSPSCSPLGGKGLAGARKQLFLFVGVFIVPLHWESLRFTKRMANQVTFFHRSLATSRPNFSEYSAYIRKNSLVRFLVSFSIMLCDVGHTCPAGGAEGNRDIAVYAESAPRREALHSLTR